MHSWKVQPPGVGEFPPGARMPPRVLSDFELVWMVAGTARLVAEPPLELRPGDLVLLPAGHAHAIEWDDVRPTRHGYVHSPLRHGWCCRPNPCGSG